MENITCPYCWQKIDFDLPGYSDVSIELVVDCEVCCRPITVTVEWTSPDEEPLISAEAES